MKSIINNKWHWIFVIVATVIFITANQFTAFLSIAGGVFISATLIQLFHFSDDKLLGDIDTYEEIIKNQNLAYAIYLLNISLLLLGGFGFSALVFFTLK